MSKLCSHQFERAATDAVEACLCPQATIRLLYATTGAGIQNPDCWRRHPQPHPCVAHHIYVTSQYKIYPGGLQAEGFQLLTVAHY